MSNGFYNATGAPVTSSPGASATIRSEFALVAAGFDKLPATLTANKAVIINAGGTAMTISTGNLSLLGNLTVATGKTLTANSTLTFAGTDGKTLTVSNSLTFTGTDGSSVAFGTGGTVLYTTSTYIASIAGTANEITAATVSNATTISLPAALTFTGKTVTGGTFNSPTMVTPALGTPSALVLTNATGTPSAIGLANATGTPSAIGLANGTGLPISTGVSGLASGIATFLATSTSANLLAALTTKTGTGNAVFSISPTFTGTLIAAAATFSGALTASGGITENSASGFIQNSFSVTTIYASTSITQSSGSPTSFTVVPRTNGVLLNDGATSWSAASDETLKTPFIPFVDALEKVSRIKVGTGRYLTDPEGTSRSFLSAQSLRAVLPEAVSSHPVNSEKPSDMDGKLLASYTDPIPLLIAALAEALTRIEILENRA